ncbi:MAG: fimbrial protein [Serratia sp. (in: enterobacteria)]|uniref:fimbrial protein n=1 Tax=Serratia sp. (in: enterobacteria) TaxID=616 RepID=UPI003F3B349D
MFKRVFVLNMLLSALAVLPGTKVEAADVTITGKVIASSCTVNPVLVAGQEVNLGTLGRTRFQNANEAGDWKSFTLNLTNCPAGTTSVKATYTGTPDGTDATLFANTEPAATAAPYMAVQMAKDADHSAILSTGSTMTANVDTLTGTATFPLAARMYTPSGGAQAGQVSSSVLVNFTYQ